MVVRIEKLQKSFPENGHDRLVLKGIDYRFVPGRLYVLKGRSGCGKSTLFSLIGLLDKPSSGTILFDGRDIQAMSDKEREEFRQKNISFLTQDENDIPEWSVIDNLHLVSKDDERIERTISRLGLADKKKQNAENLSQGEKIRLAMARILLEDKNLLLLDEPTANLDETNAKILFGILCELSKTRIVIVISHDYQEEWHLPDLVLLHLRHGKIVEDTPPEEDTPSADSDRLLRLPKRAYLSLSLLTIRKSVFRTTLAFLLLSLFSLVVFLFASLLSFDPSPFLDQGEFLSPNDINALSFLNDMAYLIWLILLAGVLFFVLTLFLLSYAYGREERKRMCLLRLIGFSERENFLLSSIPLLLVAFSSAVVGLILYFSLHGMLESLVAKAFASEAFPFLPMTPFLALPFLLLPLFALLFAFLKTHAIGRKLADQIKQAKE